MTDDDLDWDKILESAQQEQTDAGLAHIALQLANFRNELIKCEFTPSQAFLLVKEFFYTLMQRFFELQEEAE